MIKFFIDVYCKDTIIGLCPFENITANKVYKNKHSNLFQTQKKNFNPGFIDPILCHL
ncbi:MAG: hypothetical protein LUG16_01565 [Candidatus Gastranaerophilales bacterium]|nr:hypothetical protein [Candidatus Gastranaerophilales bacterium]